MDSNIVTTIVYFNGSIIISDESVIFGCDYPVWVYLSDTISLEELKVELYQSINIGFQKKVEKIRYRCPISNVNGNIKFRAVTINSDRDMRVMFRMYRQYQTFNAVMELYVDFEEIIAEAGPSSYPDNQNYDESVPNSYPVSAIIIRFANFYFEINMYLFYYDYYYLLLLLYDIQSILYTCLLLRILCIINIYH